MDAEKQPLDSESAPSKTPQPKKPAKATTALTLLLNWRSRLGIWYCRLLTIVEVIGLLGVVITSPDEGIYQGNNAGRMDAFECFLLSSVCLALKVVYEYTRDASHGLQVGKYGLPVFSKDRLGYLNVTEMALLGVMTLCTLIAIALGAKFRNLVLLTIPAIAVSVMLIKVIYEYFRETSIHYDYRAVNTVDLSN